MSDDDFGAPRKKQASKDLRRAFAEATGNSESRKLVDGTSRSKLRLRLERHEVSVDPRANRVFHDQIPGFALDVQIVGSRRITNDGRIRQVVRVEYSGPTATGIELPIPPWEVPLTGEPSGPAIMEVDVWKRGGHITLAEGAPRVAMWNPPTPPYVQGHTSFCADCYVAPQHEPKLEEALESYLHAHISRSLGLL